MRLPILFFATSVLRLAAAGPEPGPAVSAINAFGPKLHRELPAQGNSLISPWSFDTAMAMVYAGADQPVAEEMAAALGLPAADPALYQSFGALGKALLAVSAGSPPLTIRSANRLFVQEGETLGKQWLETVRTDFSAGSESLDFAKHVNEAEHAINSWVKQQTNGMIPAIVSNLNRSTRVVLANAACMDMGWEERFTASLTHDLPFHVSPTASKTVPIMFKQHRMRYAKRDGFQIAALPYAGGAFQFVALVPDEIGGIAELEKKLTPELTTECARLGTAEVRLWLPRIRLEYVVRNLPETLKKMGMRKAFNPGGFAAISPGLALDKVFHNTFIEIDEDGTKAAAATAIAMARANGAPHEVPHHKVRADRPFLFLIQHILTGACIFLGRCADPSQTK